MEPKPYASLSGNLLARKGTARPAMRRPHMGNSHNPTLPSSVQDDLGWNDMGEEEAGVTPPLTMVSEDNEGLKPTKPSPVTRQQEDLAQKLTEGSAVESPLANKQQPETPHAETMVSATPAMSTVALTAPKTVHGKGRAGAKVRLRKAKAAFTLRLDPERHLRLRLACAVGNRSAQHIVTEALDAFLDSHPDLEKLANQVPAPDSMGSGTREQK